MISKTPTYNLMVVIKETGLKADVLRAWEKRYGLPAPQRTQGGHRLYSDYDIAVIMWLKSRLADGLSISRAVKLWKDLVASGRMPLDEVWTSRPVAAPSAAHPSSADLVSLRNSWLEACLNFDTLRAEEILNQALSWFPVERVGEELLGEGLQQLGREWYQGRVSVQQEHFASAMAIRRIQSLITAAPLPIRAQTLVIGCPPGELHTFSALLLNLLLLHKGLRVVYLGAALPLAQLGESITAINPNLVILTAQQLVTAAGLVSLTKDLQLRGFPVAFGGWVFNQYPDLRSRIPGIFLGETLEDAVAKVEGLIQAPGGMVETHSLVNPYESLLLQFKQVRPAIDLTVESEFIKIGFSPERMEEINTYMEERLVAALTLGNMDFLQGEMNWLQSLIMNHGESIDHLRTFLQTYNKALEIQLGSQGQPISSWMREYITGMPGGN